MFTSTWDDKFVRNTHVFPMSMHLMWIINPMHMPQQLCQAPACWVKWLSHTISQMKSALHSDSSWEDFLKNSHFLGLLVKFSERWQLCKCSMRLRRWVRSQSLILIFGTGVYSWAAEDPVGNTSPRTGWLMGWTRWS